MRAALLQARTGTDPLLGARALVEAVEQAAAVGADMLFTPEMSAVLDRDRARAAGAITSEGEDVALAAVRETAAKHKLWVHLGSLAIRSGEGDGRFSNRGFVIDADGQVRARYDKVHLFDVTLATGERYQESLGYAPGQRAVAVNTPWGRLGLSICYDLRFPALFQALAEAGASFCAVPAAFTVPTGRAHWEVLLRARAIETGCFIIAAAQTGRHADGRETWGHSAVVDPWGEVLVDMGREPGLALVDLDVARLAEVRERLPVQRHRRPIGPVEVMA